MAATPEMLPRQSPADRPAAPPEKPLTTERLRAMCRAAADAQPQALQPVGAAGALTGIPVTSNKPRHYLKDDFADLFNPSLAGAALDAAIDQWRTRHLAPAELLRIRVLKEADANGDQVPVKLPDGTSRLLEPGPTRRIAKGFLEGFVPRFFTKPHLIFLSQSGEKVPTADHLFAQQLGLDINASKLLPDLIIAETAPHLLLVFVEFVATDGPITQRRKEQLLQLARGTKVPPDHVAFVTAFLDRSRAPFPTKMGELAWNTFAWCAAEPERLIALFDQQEPPHLKLASLVQLARPK